jgi:hypothetical protein
MNPLRPGTDKSPTGQRLNISLAFADNKNRWQRAAFRINEIIERIPRIKLDVPADEAPKVTKKEKRTATLARNKLDGAYLMVNSEFDVTRKLLKRELELMSNRARYEYRLDSTMMDATMEAIHRILVGDILSGSEFWTTRFFLNPNLNESSKNGLTDSFDSALRITEGTSAEASLAILSAEQQLQQPAYLDRLRLVHGRTFESMKGLTNDMTAQLRVTLTEGMARGVGIRDLKGMINKRLGIGMVRAERIARTEINVAYRAAYLDEAKDLNEDALKDDEWIIQQAHRSALADTSRRLHMARHGTIHTIRAQKDWWATGSNSINCLCSTLDVLVNKATGEILQSKMIDRMLDQREQMTGIKTIKVKK